MIRTTRLVGTAAAAGLAAAAIALPASAGMSPSVTVKVDVMGNQAHATAAVSHFMLDAKEVGMKKMAGHGHLHFSLDNGKYDYPKYSGANGALAVKLGIAGKYSPSVTPTITYKNLPAGKHTLVVFLANNDHSPEGAKATTTFTVK